MLIDGHREEILTLVDKFPLVFIKGETACGESSRLPPFLLEGHPTFSVAVGVPRVISAESLAQRVSTELGPRIGERVGYSTGRDKQLPTTDVGSLVYAPLKCIRDILKAKQRSGFHFVIMPATLGPEQLFDHFAASDATIALPGRLQTGDLHEDNRICI